MLSDRMDSETFATGALPSVRVFRHVKEPTLLGAACLYAQVIFQIVLHGSAQKSSVHAYSCIALTYCSSL